MNPLLNEIVRQTIVFMLVMALLIFGPALSIAYWQGWVYWLLFSTLTLAAAIYFVKTDPALVQRRRHVGATAETEPTQKIIMAILSVLMVALYVVSGLDYFWNGARVPPPLVIIADIGVAIGYAIIVITLRSNTFAASTIGVERDQRVVSSGPYAIVRHPMYSGATLMFLATPLALGSLWGLIPAVLIVAGMAARLLNEEQVLVARLQGYDAYRARVRTRLIPGIW
jgi:protein-S-isoprenylcysteine O-methyltransferase Ste14